MSRQGTGLKQLNLLLLKRSAYAQDGFSRLVGMHKLSSRCERFYFDFHLCENIARPRPYPDADAASSCRVHRLRARRLPVARQYPC